jgi:putative acetyltransferase
MIDFYLARSAEDYAGARIMFLEYAASLAIDLHFQGFAAEVEMLSEMYAVPRGGIILVKEDATLVGCAGIRKLDEATGELKRMYLRPVCQGRGIGKKLLQEALTLARQSNYSRLRLDTLNYMHAAIHLYRQAGFYEIPAYYYNPAATAVYFEMLL